MKITRDHHASYMVKLSPFLALAYLGQSYLFMKYGPPLLANEIVATIGLSLALLIVAFMTHDKFHHIQLYNNHLEIKFSPLKLQRDLLYRNIQSVQVKRPGKAFSDVILQMKCGEVIKLYHVDNPAMIQEILSKKRAPKGALC